MNQAAKMVSFFVFPGIVFLAHLIAVTVLDLSTMYPNLDIPFPSMGGLSLSSPTSPILSFLASEKITAALSRLIFLMLLFSLTATTTVFWEFAEFILDQLLDTTLQPSIANTMQDQFLGILGGST